MNQTGMDAPAADDRSPGGLDLVLRRLRRLMFLVIVAALAFLAVWLYLKQRVDTELCRYLEGHLASHYGQQGLAVSIGAARLIERQGIEIRDLVIAERDEGGAGNELVHIDQIMAACDIRLQDLVGQPPPVRQVTMRRLRINGRRGADGQWDLMRLLPLPKLGDRPPPLKVDNATINLACGGSDAEPIQLRQIHATVTRTPQGETGGQIIQLHGTLSGDHVQLVRFSGTIDPSTGAWHFEGAATDVRLSPQLFAQLPPEATEPLAMLAGLRGHLALAFTVGCRPGAERPLELSVNGKLTGGQLEDQRLPYPISDITADLHCDAGGVRIEHLTARGGLGTIRLSARRDGYEADSPLWLHCQVRQLVLDQWLANGALGSLEDLWQKLSPAGTVDVDLKLAFDGRQWNPDVTIQCLDVSFAHYQFPYRVRGCIGTIHYTRQQCKLDLHGLVSGRVARITGQLQQPGPDYTGWVEVALDGPVTLNEEIIGALKPKPQRLVRALHPRGMITFHGRFERKDPRQAKPSQRLTIGLIDCGIKYDKFPYPVERIRGTLEMTDGQWIFQRLEGYNDSGYIICDGSLTKQQDGREQLELTFTATSLPLEDELRDALSPAGQRVWKQLRPRGTLDQVKAVFRMSSGQSKPLLDLWAQKQLAENQDVEGRMISVHPVWFPYRLEGVRGAFHYRNGQVTLRDVRAHHGPTRVSLDGQCWFTPEQWKVTLTKLTADHLRPDHQLAAALPGGLGAALQKLNLTGLMTMQGSLELAGVAQPGRPVQARWDLNFDIEQGGLDCGIQLRDIRGGVHLVGDFAEYGFRSSGQLELDSLLYKDVQLTAVRGPIWIDGFRVALGRWAHPAGAADTAVPLVARVFGGTLQCDAQTAVIGEPRFDVLLALQGADLAQLDRDLTLGGKRVSGKIDAQLKLNGTHQGTHTWRGGGRVRLYQADLYEVPVILALLKILSVRRPDTTAFDTGEMDFRIQGSHIYLDRIDLSGDAISLRGNGEMSLDRRINLTFYTIVGRNEFVVPLVSPILGLASREILQIHVDGTLDHPNPPVSEVLPGLNETLRQLFPELETRERSAQRPGLLRLPRAGPAGRR